VGKLYHDYCRTSIVELKVAKLPHRREHLHEDDRRSGLRSQYERDPSIPSRVSSLCDHPPHPSSEASRHVPLAGHRGSAARPLLVHRARGRQCLFRSHRRGPPSAG
jgi:hypothetical protein